MHADETDVQAILAEQCRHQIRVARRRQPAWISWLFAVGLGLAVLGLIPSIVWFREEGAPLLRVVFLAGCVLFFGWAVAAQLLPFRPRPRIVPYFPRQLGEYGGPTSRAFARGRGLYREIVGLERLAGALGVRPLSAFGFAYDHYEQEVRWHAASEGLRTVEALRQGIRPPLLTAPDVADDLEALASVVRAAADEGVDFSLVLRLHAKDSMQAVCTREHRQGSFW